MVEKVLQLNNEKTIFWSLIGLLLLGIGFYMYLINATVHNIVARENFETEASALTLAIGKQEFAYIQARNSITLEMAYSMGFKDIAEKTYVSRNKVSQVSYLTR
jgi:hypothetical protein